MVSAEYIKKRAIELGFNCCGIARCRNLDEQKVFFNNWLSRGFHSGLDYMTRYQDIRFDPQRLLDGAKTVIVCAVNYKNDTIFECRQNPNPGIATYALAEDYHNTIKHMLAHMVASLKERCPELRTRTFTDTAPLLEKAWAVEAGLGWIGRNSLLVTPEFGSLVLLGEIVIDAEADDYDQPWRENCCGECRACVEACPNGAIVSDKVVDTGRCISRLTVETNIGEASVAGACAEDTAGSASVVVGSSVSCGARDSCRPSLHGWVFGCDVCQSVCPHNRKSPVAINPDFMPVVDRQLLTRDFWLGLDERQFKITFGKTPLMRAGLSAIQHFYYLGRDNSQHLMVIQKLYKPKDIQSKN